MRRLIWVLMMVVMVGCSRVPAPPPAGEPTGPAVPPSAEPAPPPAQPSLVSDAVPPLPAGGCVPDLSAAYTEQKLGGVALRPPAVPGTPEHPWAMSMAVTHMPGPDGLLGDTAAVRSGVVVAGTEETVVNVYLEPAPPDDWYAKQMLVEGTTPIGVQYTTMGVHLRVEAGKAGQAFRITLKDVLRADGSTGDFAVTFCRQDAPTATLLFKSGGQWVPLGEDGYVPGTAPLELRVQFSREMDRETVEMAIQSIAEASRIGGTKWIDDKTLDVTVVQPGTMFPLHLKGARDRYLQYLARGVPIVYPGEPAHLVAVDPATGKEKRVADLPPQIEGADVSLDGRQVRVHAERWRAGSMPGRATDLLDLATGQRRRLGDQEFFQWLTGGRRAGVQWAPESVTLFWYGGDGVVKSVLRGLPKNEVARLDPTGQRLYLLEPVEQQAPYPIHVYRLLTVSADGKGPAVQGPQLLQARPGKGGIMMYDPAWSPDGKQIAYTQPSDGGRMLLVVVDALTGAVRTLALDLPDLRGMNWDRVVWSPDGQYLAVASALINVATGKVEGTVENIGASQPWSPDGQWLLAGGAAVQWRTGRRVALGDGMLLGWTAEGQALVIRGARPYPQLHYNK